MDYMRLMNALSGTYPNEYTRYYASQLMEKQNADAIDVLTGATDSWHIFTRLAKAAVKSAGNGDRNIAVVRIAQTPEEGKRE
jgi:major membrane immunogen (membrane-anchored lipoprotein)